MAGAIAILRGERMRGERGSHPDFPLFPIGPVLQSYGGDSVAEGYGWRPYKCPWHGDRDASGSVNTQLQIYNCHAADCPKGNAVQVIMQAEGVTYGEAIRRAKQISGEVGTETSSTQRRSGGARRGRGAGSSRVWRRPQ